MSSYRQIFLWSVYLVLNGSSTKLMLVLESLLVCLQITHISCCKESRQCCCEVEKGCCIPKPTLKNPLQ